MIADLLGKNIRLNKSAIIFILVNDESFFKPFAINIYRIAILKIRRKPRVYRVKTKNHVTLLVWSGELY